MKKTFRQCAIDYIQNRHLCKGCVDYIVAQLNKLAKIEQIVKKELSPLSIDEMSNAEIQIKGVLENG